MTSTLRDSLLFVGHTQGWQTIDDLVDRLDNVNAWDDVDIEHAVRNWKKHQIRREIKKLKDSTGWPIFASVVFVNEDGDEIRGYKQEALFDRDDYQQVINYHSGVAIHHWNMARGYKERAATRSYYVTLPMPLPGLDAA